MAASVAFRHLAIRTRAIAQARKFYEEGLGLRFVGFRPASEAMDLSDGSVNLTLIPYEGPARTALEEGTEFIHIGFWVDDLAATFERFIALGAPVVREDVKERRLPGSAPLETGSFKVLDPDGNVLDISGNVDEWRI
jgi:catechol 2,3-dioxygenase-like lactoylglutathione lyase family enzyme